MTTSPADWLPVPGEVRPGSAMPFLTELRLPSRWCWDKRNSRRQCIASDGVFVLFGQALEWQHSASQPLWWLPRQLGVRTMMEVCSPALLAGRRLQFLTDSCKFLTEKIMGAQSFNFALKLPQNGDSPVLHSDSILTLMTVWSIRAGKIIGTTITVAYACSYRTVLKILGLGLTFCVSCFCIRFFCKV